jgi:hypothetical protein
MATVPMSILIAIDLVELQIAALLRQQGRVSIL